MKKMLFLAQIAYLPLCRCKYFGRIIRTISFFDYICNMFDCHTHNLDLKNQDFAIVNCPLDADYASYKLFSMGIHPWDVDDRWKQKLDLLNDALNKIQIKHLDSRLAAIGEIGLDKYKGGSMNMQTRCLEEQLKIAQRLKKPVILHCVKANDEMLAVMKGVDLTYRILHGFRGKPQQAEQLIEHGFFLSFGINHNAESLKLAYRHGRIGEESALESRTDRRP